MKAELNYNGEIRILEIPEYIVHIYNLIDMLATIRLEEGINIGSDNIDEEIPYNNAYDYVDAYFKRLSEEQFGKHELWCTGYFRTDDQPDIMISCEITDPED